MLTDRSWHGPCLFASYATKNSERIGMGTKSSIRGRNGYIVGTWKNQDWLIMFTSGAYQEYYFRTYTETLKKPFSPAKSFKVTRIFHWFYF